MFRNLVLVFIVLTFFVGCASIPMESREKSDSAKKFSSPTEGSSGLYIYRSGVFGGALKKDVWVDGECVGETAPNIFFYTEVKGGEDHKISTESEFSPNHLTLKTESGKNYFIKQYIKLGVFVGGANVKVVDENKAKRKILKLKLAKKGICSQQLKKNK